MKIMIDLSKVDWKLLREQKYALIDLLESIIKRSANKNRDVTGGIINLLDDIQDQAAEQIGEEKVFGKEINK